MNARKTTEETLRAIPFRKDTQSILISEKVNGEDSPVYSIGISDPEVAAEDIYNLLVQILETTGITCKPVNRVVIPSGQVIIGMHMEAECEGVGCPVHHPSLHHLSELSQSWDPETGTMMRVCKHGIKHPDPDQVAMDGRSVQHKCCKHECCKEGNA